MLANIKESEIANFVDENYKLDIHILNCESKHIDWIEKLIHPSPQKRWESASIALEKLRENLTEEKIENNFLLQEDYQHDRPSSTNTAYAELQTISFGQTYPLPQKVKNIKSPNIADLIFLKSSVEITFAKTISIILLSLTILLFLNGEMTPLCQKVLEILSSQYPASELEVLINKIQHAENFIKINVSILQIVSVVLTFNDPEDNNYLNIQFLILITVWLLVYFFPSLI